MEHIFLLRQPSGGVIRKNDFFQKDQKGLICTKGQGVYLHQKNVIDCF